MDILVSWMMSVVQKVSAAIVNRILTVEENTVESPCTVSRSVLIKDKLNGRPRGKKKI